MSKMILSMDTGAVLPYNKKLAERPNAKVIPAEEGKRLMDERNAARLEKSGYAVQQEKFDAPPPEPSPMGSFQPENVVRQALPESEEMVVTDVEDGEPDVETLVAALEGDNGED